MDSEKPYLTELVKHQFLQACLAQSTEQATVLPSKLLSEADWAEVVAMAARHGVLPLLYERLSTGPQRPAVPEGVLQRLRDGFLMNGAKNALLYKELARVLRVLQRANIPVIVLKGAHLAALVYSQAAVRAMHDIDLLVHRSDLERTASSLRELGYFSKCRTVDTAVWWEHNRHLPRMFKPPGPGIEIHWAISDSSLFSRITTAGLWDRSRTTSIAGVEARVLSPEDLLLHLCLHTAADAAGPFRLGLRPLCDIAATVCCYQKEITWQQIQSRAIEWQADRCVYLALWLARELLAAGIPDSVLGSLRPQEFDDHWAALAMNEVVLTGAEGLPPGAEGACTSLRNLLTRFGSGPWRSKAGLLLLALFPSRAHMAKYMATNHGVPLNPVRNYSCYLTRAIYWIRTAWQLLTHRRLVAACVRQVPSRTLLWNWLIGTNAERQPPDG
jgi:Uncharacterised nucleotidyltransferase